MSNASAQGADAVAAAGAEHITASDRSYFGVELRREHVVPIFVENPNEHELRDEGKGMTVWGRDLPRRAVEVARRAVYGRRLADGPIALERYNLANEAERNRALAVLAELVPRGSSGHAVWLWVNGGSDGHGKGVDAFPHLEGFQEQLRGADLELSRVVLFSKPSVRPHGATARADLETAVERANALGVPLSLQMRTTPFRQMFANE